MTSGFKRTPEQIEKIKQDILDYLEDGIGKTFYKACEYANTGCSTAYQWRDEKNQLYDEKFANAVQESLTNQKRSGLDFAEGKLMQNIGEGKEASIFFFLKTQGKERGYVERQEQEQVGKRTIVLEQPHPDLDDV